MLQWLLRWKVVAVLLVVLLLAGAIHYTSGPREQLTLVESLVRDMLSPLQWLLTRAGRGVRSGWEYVAGLGALHSRNQELAMEVRELQQQLVQLAEYRRENRWLREALDFAGTVDHSLMVAEVIGRSPSNWLRSVTINRGSRHGVEAGMAVVTGLGVVGTVEHTSSFTASVLLGTDPQSAVGALNQRTGDLILVEGDPQYSGSLHGKPLNTDAQLQVGDVVVTSGLSQMFPKGLPIGEITQVIPGPYDLTVSVLVQPFVDFTRLEYVFVVIQEM